MLLTQTPFLHAPKKHHAFFMAAALLILCLAPPTANAGLTIRQGYFWDTARQETFIPHGFAYQIWNPPVFATQTLGIKLPDNIEIPTITGRIVAVSAEVENMPEIPLKKYDKVLFNPKGAIPVDFEGDNRLFVVEVENIVAVFRKS